MARLPGNQQIIASWQESVMNAHCGLIDGEKALNLALKQWQRDIQMASTVKQAGDVILITGREHTNATRSVPLHLPSDTTVLDLVGGANFDRSRLTWLTAQQLNEKTSLLCG